ncbi:hypothetical protein [Aphanizomenon flos-aquae]|uniref:hypothetical protein n=1 Tax=Aphanizomenon flos-aquae TaxID=1176 RepID=UPI0004ADD652|nr:hypothetical protein [Aphanizomenon flos-aquae]
MNLPFNSEKQLDVSTIIETGTGINPDSELDLSDYVTSIPISQKMADEIAAEVARQLAKSTEQREETRSHLAMFLARVFGCTLGASFLLMTLITFSPNADKAAVKDFISQTLTPQVTLLSFALGFYFGSNKEK